jgi:ribose/xylose/arabinose/galactoside ABC-type transport system permease subunit
VTTTRPSGSSDAGSASPGTATTSVGAPAPAGGSGGGFGALLRSAGTAGSNVKSTLLPIAFLIILVVFFSTQTANFLQVSTLYTVAREAAVVLVVAVGLTFVILMGSIDLSVGSTVTLAGLVTAKTAQTYDWGTAFVAGIVSGVIIGVVNGLLFAYAKVPSFLATLGTSLAIDGLAQWYTGGRPVQIVDPFMLSVSRDSLLGNLPNIALWALLIWIVLSVLGANTRFGRYSYAIGGGEVVSGLAGIPVRRMKFYVMIVVSTLAAIAGLLLSLRIGAATPDMGSSLTLDAIAAVVMGGTALTGGVGGVHRTILGVLVITTLGVGLDAMVVPPYMQSIIQGAVVVLAVALTLDRSKLKILK